MSHIIKRKDFKLIFRFDRSNLHWTDDIDANVSFIESEIINLNHILKTSGRLSACAICENLGIDVFPEYYDGEFMYQKDRHEQLVISSIAGYTNVMWVSLIFSST